MKYVATINGKKYEVEVEKLEAYKSLDRNGVAAPAAAPAAGATTVEAPMPGKILNIKVSAGQAVKFGETVIVMEAMKMETEIVAPADGTVAQILVKAGDAVDTGAALVTLN